MNIRVKVAVLAIASLVAVGCSYNKIVDVAIQKYDEKHYAEALADFRSVEGNEHELSDRWHTRYLMYRGLAHFRAYRKDGGARDLQAAGLFISRALSRYEQGDRSFLSVKEEREMRVALDAVKAEVKAHPR